MLTYDLTARGRKTMYEYLYAVSYTHLTLPTT